MIAKTKNFISNCLETVHGTVKDYRILASYHYELSQPLTCTKVFKIRGRGPAQKHFPDPLCVLTFGVPLPTIHSRTEATGGWFDLPKTKSARLKLVNKNILYMSRLITLPGFRRIGLATKCVHDSLRMLDIPIVESLSPVDFTNKIFKNEGFKLYYQPLPLWIAKTKYLIRSLGLSSDYRTPPLLLHNRLLNLTGEIKTIAEKNIKQFLHHFRCVKNTEPSIERSKYILSKLKPPQVYMIWFNPRSKIASEIQAKNEGIPTKMCKTHLCNVILHTNKRPPPQRPPSPRAA